MPVFPTLHNLSSRLSQINEHQHEVARQVIEEYFDCYSPQFVQDQLWDLLVTTLSSGLPEEQTAAQRHNYIYFYEYTRLLINAVYHLHQAGE